MDDIKKSTPEGLGLTKQDLESLFEGVFEQEMGGKKTPEMKTENPVSISEDENLTPKAASKRSKTSLRMKYEAEVEHISKSHGGLEEIRRKLGLSKRKIAQLLLVDPSAWTRWTSKQGEAPPHIYRALEWYLLLQEKHPEYKSTLWLNAVATPQMNPKEIESIKKQVIESAQKSLESVEFELRGESFKENRAIERKLQKNSDEQLKIHRGLKVLAFTQGALLLLLLTLLLSR